MRIVNHRTDGEVPMSGVFGRIVSHNVVDAIPKVEARDEGVQHLPAQLDEGCSDEAARALGLFPYIARSLGISNPEDLIQLHPCLKGDWEWISRHFERIGLPFSQNVIWNDDFSVMADHRDREPSVFFFGPRAHNARPDKGWRGTVANFNSKNYFIKTCQILGLPAPDTWLFADKSEIVDVKNFPFPVYLKIAVSVSGLGVEKCETPQELEKKLEVIPPGLSFQIQQELAADAFINIQYRVNGCGLERVAATEQVLKGFSHDGNRFPTKYQPWEITDPVAKIMADSGMKGYFAFDLAIKNGQSFMIECNPRFNGATYPTIITQKLGVKTWTAKNIRGNLRNFNRIDLGEIEFNPATKNGVVVYNWGSIAEGKLGVILCGSLEAQARQEASLLKLIA